MRKALVVVILLCIGALAQNPVTADSPFQIRYVANLDKGDSLINITNTGTTDANICVNTYVFAPDEQLVACCSCVVVPNSLRSYSVNQDLVSNTNTPAVENAVTIKLLATSGGACNAAAPGAPASGLAAWATTDHPITKTTTVPNTYWWLPPVTTTVTKDYISETSFTPSTLGAAELARISALCGFIQSNGSGYGICRSCRFGGQ